MYIGVKQNKRVVVPLTSIFDERHDGGGSFFACLRVNERLVFEGKFLQILHEDGVLIELLVPQKVDDGASLERDGNQARRGNAAQHHAS